jgi:hypothetical protein
VQKQKYFEPAQYFYNFDLQVTGTGSPSSFSSLLASAGVKDLVDFVTIPLAKNKMLVRLENLSEEAQQVDLVSVAGAFGAETPYIKELSLSGNMDIQEMDARKIQWKTVDGHQSNKTKRGDDFNNVDLKSMQIRVFEV